MRIGVAAVRTTPLDFAGNQARVKALITQAYQEGVEVLVFPELCLSGYECGDFFWHPWVAAAAWESLQALVGLTENILVVVGLPLELYGRLYNAAALVGDGRIWGFALKRHLPRDGIFYEPRWFSPAPAQRLIEPRTGAPAGSALPFYWQGLGLVIEICEDAWQPARPLEAVHAHIALSLNASPYEMGKRTRRQRMVLESSYRYHCVYAYANLLGNEAGKLLYDGESLIAWNGELLAATPVFSYKEGELAWADIPVERVLRTGRQNAAPVPTQGIKVEVSPAKETEKNGEPRGTLSLRVQERWEELTEAIAMGLWDYLWKSRSRGFVVSLSGGLDSAACAVLAHLALRWAKERLPTETYQQFLAYMQGESPQVYSFYQATAQSSAETFRRAQALAEEVGLPFYRWEVQDIVEAYEKKVEGWLGRPLSWEKDDIARQNLQARARVPGIWMTANLLGALLLTTSNRSELAVGYSTMDGDSAGGLAPIGGVAKADLREWGLWAADQFGWPTLREIAWATPTAELRPGGQADEEDLMPYPVLAELERLWVRQGVAPATLRAHLAARGLPPQWADKFLRLFRLSQWKRERTAPAFHVDGHDLDPRSFARLPILHALQ
ncbi:MAG: NAD(+) synthase [Bacteroidia bacterium]|nr:NAD(+) synthase [Bacteroidia bacterium]GIV23782.1 MAG: NAD(+) synthase [Bacteroidia bacterium]